LDCRHLENIYELFLLGVLAEDESMQLRAHLAQGCANCVQRLKEAARTVYLLSLTTKSLAPGTKAKAELMRLLKSK
jgi:hypothetical protein